MKGGLEEVVIFGLSAVFYYSYFYFASVVKRNWQNLKMSERRNMTMSHFTAFPNRMEQRKNLRGEVARRSSELSGSSKLACRELALLINDMLAVRIEDRPKAAEVTQRLQRLSLWLQSCIISDKLRQSHIKKGAIHTYWEFVRFRGWCSAIGLGDPNQEDSRSRQPMEEMNVEEFDEKMSQLKDLQHVVESDHRYLFTQEQGKATAAQVPSRCVTVKPETREEALRPSIF